MAFFGTQTHMLLRASRVSKYYMGGGLLKLLREVRGGAHLMHLIVLPCVLVLLSSVFSSIGCFNLISCGSF